MLIKLVAPFITAVALLGGLLLVLSLALSLLYMAAKRLMYNIWGAEIVFETMYKLWRQEATKRDKDD